MLDKLQSSDFLPNLHDRFRVLSDGVEPIELELTQVTEIKQMSRPEARAPFSLIFLGPPIQHYLVQHTYRLEHERMGTLDLFLVPLGPAEGRMQYEAIFN